MRGSTGSSASEGGLLGSEGEGAWGSDLGGGEERNTKRRSGHEGSIPVTTTTGSGSPRDG